MAVREKELKHIILEDLQSLFNSIRENNFINSLQNKLNVKKRQLQTELQNTEAEVEAHRNKKLEYVDLYTENVITKDDLVEYRELTDNKIAVLQVRKINLMRKYNSVQTKITQLT